MADSFEFWRHGSQELQALQFPITKRKEEIARDRHWPTYMAQSKPLGGMAKPSRLKQNPPGGFAPQGVLTPNETHFE